MKLPPGALLWSAAVAVVAAAFWLTWQFVDPAPPDTIRLATGKPGGAYQQFAERYRGPLAAQGIALELVPSAGAVENLELLTGEDAPVDLAFVQGGVDVAGLNDSLTSLGSLFYEPIWVFHRREQASQVLDDLRGLRGLRIGIGGAGSGTQAVARTLLTANGIDSSAATLVEVDFAAGADALTAGTLDVLFVIASPAAEIVKRLATDAELGIVSFARADAYVRTHRYFSRVSLPEGVIDLAANRPDREITLLAVTANLIARRDFHPALVDLMLQVARDVHREPGILEEPDQFPSPNNAILPVEDDAQRFYRYGPPFLQRYLSFWTANLIDRLKIMLLPLVALLIPLVRLMPPVYQWRVRSRVYRWYRDLQRLDPARSERPPDAASVNARLGTLRELEDEVNRVRVPLSYTDELYHLRSHIELVRRDLRARQPGPGGEPIQRSVNS